MGSPQQVWREQPTGLYGDGAAILPDVSLVMSGADRTRTGMRYLPGHKSAAMPVNNSVIGGRAATSFADQQLKGRKVNAFCQTN